MGEGFLIVKEGLSLYVLNLISAQNLNGIHQGFDMLNIIKPKVLKRKEDSESLPDLEHQRRNY